MSWGVKCALSRDAMTPETSWTFWTVMLGSDSLNSSFGTRPMLCSIFALLQSLTTKEAEQNRSVTTHLSESVAKAGKSLLPNPTLTLSAVFLATVSSVWSWLCGMLPWLFQLCWTLFWLQAVHRAANKICSGPPSTTLRYVTKRSCEMIVNEFKKLHNSVSVMRFRCR